MLPNVQRTDAADHVPVLADEVRELLDVQPGETVVDATFGAGGHSRLLVTGLGAVGLGAILTARFRGARVICAARNPFRTELARSLGAVYLVAETSTLPAYEPARSFYRSNGFNLIAEVPDWHDDGDGMMIFRKRL